METTPDNEITTMVAMPMEGSITVIATCDHCFNQITQTPSGAVAFAWYHIYTGHEMCWASSRGRKS
jgi:hypothetical protein